MTLESTEVELRRTVRYGYRQGNLYGGMHTAWQEDTITVDRIREETAAHLGTGEDLSREAVLTVPEGEPGSAEGILIQIRWAIRVRITCADHRDTVAEHTLEVQHSAREAAADAGSPLEENTRGWATMTFQSLSSRTLVPGRPLTGTLRMAARKPVPARGVRFELVLEEHVDHGPGAGADPARSPANDDKHVETVVADRIEDCASLEAGGTVEIPFSVPVPEALPAASLRRPPLRIRWVLRAVLDLPLRPDPTVTLPLHAPSTTALNRSAASEGRQR
ncbi:hypothetical protein [Kocuria aegyptia]|uniref:hypothetical protein n=1 Tax=Kocuria aegyptia TaxID=330943 RepID=UPI0031DA9390